MTRTPHRRFASLARAGWLALGICSFSGACDSSSDSAPTPITFSIAIDRVEQNTDLAQVNLRCDHRAGAALSTLSVGVSISSDPADNFVLRPANACGESVRCGYVRITALSTTDDVLASVDTATAEGVLELPIARLPELAKLEAQLVRGLDQQPLENPDGEPVVASIEPAFVIPTDCVDEPGESAAGGAPSDGGSGGAPSDAGSSAGGVPSDAGAANGGSGDEPAAGAGGAADVTPPAGAGAGTSGP